MKYTVPMRLLNLEVLTSKEMAVFEWCKNSDAPKLQHKSLVAKKAIDLSNSATQSTKQFVKLDLIALKPVGKKETLLRNGQCSNSMNYTVRKNCNRIRLNELPSYRISKFIREQSIHPPEQERFLVLKCSSTHLYGKDDVKNGPMCSAYYVEQSEVV